MDNSERLIAEAKKEGLPGVKTSRGVILLNEESSSFNRIRLVAVNTLTLQKDLEKRMKQLTDKYNTFLIDRDVADYKQQCLAIAKHAVVGLELYLNELKESIAEESKGSQND